MNYQHPEYLVETDWLHAHLADPNLRVLDCTAYLPNYFDASAAQKVEIVSGRAHYEQGHIPGSVFADIIHDLSDQQNKKFMFPMPSATQFAAAMSRYGVGEGSRVVLYDDMFNVWAARVWWMLRAFGFENAAILNGGWKKWESEGRPITTEPSSYPAAHFVAHPHPERIATKDEVLAAIDSGATCLVNGLDPEEFAGRGPVRYGRPGHIPSSINLPFVGVVDLATSTYLKPDQLHALALQTGAMDKERVIAYCGGAIAASSAAFALSLLGVENVAVYDGSLTEWAADPTLPLVTNEA
ncbi:MAG: sulfurtransferase [Caldilineaceae bacterium]